MKSRIISVVLYSTAFGVLISLVAFCFICLSVGSSLNPEINMATPIVNASSKHTASVSSKQSYIKVSENCTYHDFIEIRFI